MTAAKSLLYTFFSGSSVSKRSLAAAGMLGELPLWEPEDCEIGLVGRDVIKAEVCNDHG